MPSRLSYSCTVDGREVSSSVDSSKPRDSPVDASDLHAVYSSARSGAGASSSAPVVCSRLDRVRKTQDADREWISRKMTPSCKNHNWDLNSIVSYDRWTCNYVGKGTVVDKSGNKKEVYNPFKQWSGTIASCADLGETTDLSIPESTMNAVQRMAYWQADGDNADLDVDQFLCRIESLPRM